MAVAVAIEGEEQSVKLGTRAGNRPGDQRASERQQGGRRKAAFLIRLSWRSGVLGGGVMAGERVWAVTVNESLESGPQSREAWWRLPLRRETRTRNARGSHEERGPGRGTGCCFRAVLCFVLCVCEEEEGRKMLVGLGLGVGAVHRTSEKKVHGSVRYRQVTRYVTYKVRRQREPGRGKKEGRG